MRRQRPAAAGRIAVAGGDRLHHDVLHDDGRASDRAVGDPPQIGAVASRSFVTSAPGTPQAMAELGYQETPAAQLVRDTVEWYRTSAG